MTQTFKVLFLTIMMAVTLSGCAYKIDVQQGNIITNKDLKTIQPGMTQATVEKRLGLPILRNIYKDGRTVYVYTIKRGHHAMQRRNLFIYFRHGKVARVRQAHGTDKHGKY